MFLDKPSPACLFSTTLLHTGRADRQKNRSKTEVNHFDYLSCATRRNGVELEPAHSGPNRRPFARAGTKTSGSPGGPSGIRAAGSDLHQRPWKGARNYPNHRGPTTSDRPDSADAGAPGMRLRPVGGSHLSGDQRTLPGRLGGLAARRPSREPHRRRKFSIAAAKGRPCFRYGGAGSAGRGNRFDIGPPRTAQGHPLPCPRAGSDFSKPFFDDQLFALGAGMPSGAPDPPHPDERHLPSFRLAKAGCRRGFNRMIREGGIPEEVRFLHDRRRHGDAPLRRSR